MVDYLDYKWRLAAVRVQLGYTKTEWAELIGVCRKTVLEWEEGVYMPNMRHAQKIAEISGIPISFIDFSKEGNKYPYAKKIKSYD